MDEVGLGFIYDNLNCVFDFLPGDAGGVYPATL